ncbi:MAG: hypothetical protein Q6J46_09715 [Thermostichus sp. DG02_2_bins_29]
MYMMNDMRDREDRASYAAGRQRSQHFGWWGYLRLDCPLQAGRGVEPGFHPVPVILEDPERR